MPTKDKTAPPPADAAVADPAPTPEEAEAAVASGEEAAEPEAEVRPEEITAGIGKPVGNSAWPEEIVEELRKPLDPNRVRRREGRGSTKYEYLAGHDVKRRANEIFGFGNWGHTIEEQVEIGSVEVKKREGDGTGWHVAYRCVVRVWVRHEGGLFETHGSGYGDGVEYTPAARLTACELALKESETDALKRAFTDLGDQFGLILYAKDDEKKRVARESSRGDTSGRVVRRDHEVNVPKVWPELLSRFDATVGINVKEDGYDPKSGEGAAWLEEVVEKHYGQPSLTALDSAKRHEVFQLFASALLVLETELRSDGLDLDRRTTIQKAIAAKFGGLLVEGPPWRLGPNEQDRPVKGEAPPLDDDLPPSESAAAEVEADLERAATPSEASVAEAEHDREQARDASGK